MQELSEFNSSQKDNITKLQNQLSEYEQNNNKVLEELDKTKEHSDELLKRITEQNNRIRTLEAELTKSQNDKDRLEKGLNHKLAHYKNKLEVSQVRLHIVHSIIFSNNYILFFNK